MKSIKTLIFILTSLTVSGQATKWADFEKAWDNYLSNSTHDNSLIAYKLLPDKLTTDDYPEDGLISRIFSNIEQLEMLVQQGDRDALRLAFKLFAIADGANAEGLQIEIGKLINTNPKMFLQELKNHRQLIISLDGLVGNLGQDYVDKFDQQRAEREKELNH